MTTLNDFVVTDDVTDNLASYHNRLLGGILRAEFANTESLSATKELADSDCQLQFLTASGANRDCELPPEATTNHVHIIYNSGASNNIVVKDDAGAVTFAILAPDEFAICYPLNAESWRVDISHAERLYKLNVSVSSNDLVVSITHLDGSTPTVYRPILFVIGSTKRLVTAALSVTVADGTNWFNSGGAELGTLTVPYFLYVVWDSGDSTVALAISRLSHGRVVSDFSVTTTSDKHLYPHANFSATDEVGNIGYFEATLSLAGTSHLWTIPTFTNLNLRHEKTLESRPMTWTPTNSASGSLTWTSISTIYAKYKVVPNRVIIDLRQTGTLGGTASTDINATLPFDAVLATGGATPTFGAGQTAGVAAKVFITDATPDYLSFQKYDASNYATSGSCTISTNGSYEI